MILLVALAAGALWLMTSRQRKQQKAAEDFRQHLEPGERIMTHSGMVASVVQVENGLITLESESGDRTEWILAAVARRYEAPAAVEEESEDGADEEYADDEYDDEGEYDDGEYDDEDEYEDDADVLDVEVPDDVSSLTGPDPVVAEGTSDDAANAADEPPATDDTPNDTK
jgi:preprotein translocase subunit YajC